MKKYLIAVLLLFIPCVTYALTMCARDNSLVISLYPGSTLKDISYNLAEYTWSGTFDSGTILGEATCLGQAEGGWPSPVNPGCVVNSNGNRVDSSIPKGFGKGQFCWCRMTHPGFSSWVFAANHNSAGTCVTSCAKSCTSILTNGNFIKALFYNIGK